MRIMGMQAVDSPSPLSRVAEAIKRVGLRQADRLTLWPVSAAAPGRGPSRCPPLIGCVPEKASTHRLQHVAATTRIETQSFTGKCCSSTADTILVSKGEVPSCIHPCPKHLRPHGAATQATSMFSSVWMSLHPAAAAAAVTVLLGRSQCDARNVARGRFEV